MVVPDQYMCSITAEIMTDPVSTVCHSALDSPAASRRPLSYTHMPRPHQLTLRPTLLYTHRPSPWRPQVDGFTYERSAIELWLETHNTSPATGLELQSKQLNPNHSIRSLIREFRDAGA